ncbi:MAG: helix-turn-helix domain-containing protein [Chloroflexota bacterium]
MAALPTLLSLPEAARKYGLSEARLKTMIDNGKIKAAMIGEEIVVNEDEVRAKTIQRKEDLPEYKKHAHLKGVPIWVSEAARKYQITDRTIINWVERGFIKTLGYEKNRRLLDEADVAYCAEIYNQNKGQGKWTFDKYGLPRKKTGPLTTT